MSDHRYFAPSSAEKWINCPFAAPGEARIIEQYGAEPPGPWMLEGTEAHAKLERILKTPGDPMAALLSDKYNQDDRNCFGPYIRAIREDLEMFEAELLVERTFQSRIDARLGGTPDAVVYSIPERTLIVTDYKHGVNHYVEADAWQLKTYGYLAAAELGVENFDTIILRVVQPRHYSGADPVREHCIEDAGDWCQLFRSVLINAINASDAPDPEPVKGDHCRWCKAICPLRVSDINDVIGVDVKAINPEVEQDLETLREVLDSEERIKATIDVAKALATWLIQIGYHIPGYGLKESVSNRKWVSDSDDKIARALRSRGLDKSLVWVKKLISPAQAEKKCDLDDKFYNKFVIRESKGVRLAKMEPGDIPAETAKEKLEKQEMTDSEKALLEGF